MDTVYIETSVINKVLEESMTGTGFRATLADSGYRPVVGMHTIYELAKTFLDPEQTTIGQQLFTILRDIDGSIVPMTNMLLEQEIIKLHTGAAVLPMLDTNNQASTRYDIERFSKGIIISEAITFIETRENERRANEPLEDEGYLHRVRQVNKYNPNEYRNIKTFEDALGYFDSRIPGFIVPILKGGVSNSEAKELYQRLDSFPSLRSVVRANLYLCFIIIRNEQHPSYDRVDDFRHVIDASYCDAFFTNDRQLSRTANCINPDITVFTWKEIMK